MTALAYKLEIHISGMDDVFWPVAAVYRYQTMQAYEQCECPLSYPIVAIHAAPDRPRLLLT